MHGATGYPTRSTLHKALKMGRITMWPGLTPQYVHKYIQENITTDKGHLHMTRQVKKRNQEKMKQNQNEDEALNP